MGAATLSMLPGHRGNSLRGSLLASIILHGCLFAAIAAYTIIGHHLGPSWGQSATQNAVHVTAVASLPGIPLPSPKLTTHNPVAVQNPGLYQNQPVPKPPPTPDMEKIPKFKEAIKPPKKPIINKRIQKQPPPPPPDNAVPYGQGGAPTMTYSTEQTAQGPAGIHINEQDFGERFGWYVQAVRNRISSNWLLATISPGITSAPRVFVQFKIHRDGSITDAQVTQSSGIPEVDRSALRAVLASSPLAALPPGYSGDSVSVQFYFDFHR